MSSDVFENVIGVSVTGADLDDSLTIEGDIPRYKVNFDGGGGNDNLVINGGNYDSVTYGLNDPSSGSFLLDNNSYSRTEGRINYNGVETITDMSNAADRIFNGSASDDNIRLKDDGNNGNGLSTIDISGTDGLGSITFGNPFNSLSINAGDGSDTITLEGLDSGLSADVALEGGVGTDTLVADDTDNTWNITGQNEGTLNSNGFSGIENLTGGAGSDTLTGPAMDSTWNITGSNSGNVGGVNFEGMENLTGAVDNEDTFVFQDGASLSGVVEGGDGGFDSLVIEEGNYNKVIHSYSGPDSGIIDLDGNIIMYSGLEPVYESSITGVKTFNMLPPYNPFTAGGDTIIISDYDGGLSAYQTGYSQIKPSVGETVIFKNPTTSLILNAQGGADNITVNALDPGFNANLIINSEGGDDDITLNAVTGPGTYTINGGTGNDTFTIDSIGNKAVTLNGDGGSDTYNFDNSSGQLGGSSNPVTILDSSGTNDELNFTDFSGTLTSLTNILATGQDGSKINFPSNAFENFTRGTNTHVKLSSAAVDKILDGLQELTDWAKGLNTLNELDMELPVIAGNVKATVGNAMDIAEALDQIRIKILNKVNSLATVTTDDVISALTGVVPGFDNAISHLDKAITADLIFPDLNTNLFNKTQIFKFSIIVNDATSIQIIPDLSGFASGTQISVNELITKINEKIATTDLVNKVQAVVTEGRVAIQATAPEFTNLKVTAFDDAISELGFRSTLQSVFAGALEGLGPLNVPVIPGVALAIDFGAGGVPELGLDFTYSADRTNALNIDLGKNASDVGIQFDANAKLNMTSNLSASLGLNLELGLTPVLTLDINSMNADASVSGAVNGGLMVGFLEANATGTINMSASLGVSFPGGIDIMPTNLSSLTPTFTPTSDLALDLDISVSGLSGYTDPGTLPNISITSTDLFTGDRDVNISFSNFNELFNFDNINAATFAGLLGQLAGWLDGFGGERLANIEIPFTNKSLSDVLDFKDMISDLLLFNDGDSAIKAGKKIVTDLNDALASAGLGSQLRAEGDGLKLKLISVDPDLTSFSISASGASWLGFGTQSTTAGVITASSNAILPAIPPGSPGDAVLNVTIGSDTTAVTVSEASLLDNVAVGFAVPLLLNADNSPAFKSAQEFASRLSTILGPAFTYDPADKTLEFAIDLTHTLFDTTVPLNFNIDLSPIGDLSSNSSLSLTADGGLSLTIGVDLDMAGTDLDSNILLSSLNGGDGVDIKSSESYLAENDVNATSWILSNDATFNLFINGSSTGTPIIIEKTATLNNTSIADLVGDINAQLSGTDVTASADGSRIKLTAGTSITSLTLNAEPGGTAVKELGFGASQEITTGRTLTANSNAPSNGKLTDGNALLALTVDGTEYNVSVSKTLTFDNTSLDDLIEDINYALALARVGNKIVAVKSGSKIKLNSVDDSVAAFSISTEEDNSAHTELGFGTSQSDSSAGSTKFLYAASGLRSSVGRFGTDISFEVTIGGTTETINIIGHDSEGILGIDMSSNSSIIDIVSDINKALRVKGLQSLDTEGMIDSSSDLRVDFAGNSLLFTGGPTVTTFSINASGDAVSKFGLKSGLYFSDKYDLVINTHNGITRKIYLDNANDIGDVIQKITDQTGGSGTLDRTDPGIVAGLTFGDVEVDFNDDHSGLRLIDRTSGGTTFAVLPMNGSKAAFDLALVGIEGLEDINKDSIVDAEDGYGIIEGGQIAGVTLTDRFYLEDAVIRGDLAISGLIDASAMFGEFVGINLNGSGSLSAGLQAGLKDPGTGTLGGRVTLSELVRGLSDISSVVEMPNFSGGGDLVLDVSLDPVSSLIPMAGTPRVTINVGDFGNPFGASLVSQAMSVYNLATGGSFDITLTSGNPTLNGLVLPVSLPVISGNTNLEDLANDLNTALQNAFSAEYAGNSALQALFPGGAPDLVTVRAVASDLSSAPDKLILNALEGHDISAFELSGVLGDAASVLGFDTTTLGDLIPDIDFDFNDLDDLLKFDTLNFDAIMAALVKLSEFLGQFEAFDFLDQNLPLIDMSVNDVLDFADRLNMAINEALVNPADTVQALDAKLKEALGLPLTSTAIQLLPDTYDFGTPETTDDIDLLKMGVHLDTGFSENVNFSMPNIDIPVLGDVFDLGGSADLGVTGSLGFDLDIGIDLDDPLDVYVYNTTGMSGSLSANASGMNFRAALGPMGLFIKDGTASISGNIKAGLDLNGDDTVDEGAGSPDRILISDLFADLSNKLAFDINGDLNVNLPTSFPTEFNDIGAFSINVSGADWNNFSLDGALTLPDFSNIDLSNMGLFDNILLAIDGIDLFLEGLQDVLDGEVFGLTIPFIGDNLSAGSGFVQDFRQDFVSPFREFIVETKDASRHFTDPHENIISNLLFDILGDPLLTGESWSLDLLKPLAADGSNPDNPDSPGSPDGPEDFIKLDTDGETYVEWNFTIGDTYGAGTEVDLDFGIPGLGIEAEGSLGIEFDWEMDLGFGLSLEDGFYIDISDENELFADVTVTLPETIIGKLGFLQLRAVDANVYDEHIGTTNLGLAFEVDITNGMVPGDQKLSISEFGQISFDAGIAAEAVAELQLFLEVNKSLFNLSDSTAAGIPKITSGFILDWGIGGYNAGDPESSQFTSLTGIGNSIKDGLKLVEFKDVSLDVGSFLSDVFGPIVSEVKDITEPIQPIIDILTAPIPIISDLGPSITLLDIAASYGDVNPGMIYAISDIISLINRIPDPSETGELLIPFGSFTIFDNTPAAVTGGTTILSELWNPGLKTSGSGGLFDQLKGNANSMPQVLDFDSLLAGISGGDAKSKSTMQALRGNEAGSGFDMPIFNDPSQVFGLLMGEPAVLVTYDMEPLFFEFEWSQFFPIWGPLGVSINIEASANIDFAFGYDTFGIQQFIEGDFRNPAQLLDGFYISDTDLPTGAFGVDVPELEFDAGLWAAAELNLGVARAGVGGGLFAEIDFDLFDPNQDGRVRISEIVMNIENQLKAPDDAEKLLAPLAPFDVHGEIFAKLFAFLKIDLLFWEVDLEFDITPPITLIEFDIDFFRPPVLATELDNGDLVLNMGRFAKDRLIGNTTDGNEDFEVKDAGPGYVEVRAHGLGDDAMIWQKYAVSSDIIAYGDEGDDTIDLSGVTNAGGYIIEGGVGDDTITLKDTATGAAVISGGDGDDTITSGAGNDIIYGGRGEDTIDAGGGNDIVFGDAGEVTTNNAAASLKFDDADDTITGGTGLDYLFGGGGDDTIEGGGDDDFIFGDNGRIHLTTKAVNDTNRGVTFGNDTLFGNANNDRIYGGKGNDTIDGGAGADTLYGEDGSDTLYGGGDDDDIHGQKGDDTIYGLRDPGASVSDSTDANSDAADTIYGNEGNDFIHGNDGGDTIYGDSGEDEIYADEGDDTVFGGTEADLIYGGDNSDTIDGGAESDIIFGDNGEADFISGTTGTQNWNNTVYGINQPHSGWEYVFGQTKSDGDDTYNDTIFAGIGSDFIDGQEGADTYLVYLQGADAFSFINISDSGSSTAVTDKMEVSGTLFDDTFLLRKAVSSLGLSFVALINEDPATERVNYWNVDGGPGIERLLVTGGLGNDYFAVDDIGAETTLSGDEGEDRFQVGQLYRSPRDECAFAYNHIEPQDIFATIETTVGWLSDGINMPMTIYGGDNNDYFTVFHNKDVLSLFGDDGDDTFLIKAFALKGSEQPIRKRTDVSGGAGVDLVQYAMNAPVNIDGGDGLDKVIVIGTEFGDDIVVTKDGVYGMGLNVNFVNIESLSVDGAEGDDRFFVQSTSEKLITELFGGLGSDTFNMSGPTPPVISNDLLGHSGIITHSIEETDTDSVYDLTNIAGISANINDNNTEDPMLVVIEPDGMTEIMEGGYNDYYKVVLSKAPGAVMNIQVMAPVQTQDQKDRQSKMFTLDSPTKTAISPDFTTITLEFDDSNWDVPQYVYVKAPDDGDTSDDNAPSGWVMPPTYVDIDDFDDDAIEGDKTGFINHVVTTSTGIEGYIDSITTVIEPDDSKLTTFIDNAPSSDFTSSLAGYVVQITDGPGAGQSLRIKEVVNQHELILFGEFRQTCNAIDTTSKYKISRDIEAVRAVQVLVHDDDKAGVVVHETGRSTDIFEGGSSDWIQVSLSRAPIADVTVNLLSNDGQLTFSDSSLTFDTSNTPQWVKVTAVDDIVREGFHHGLISFTMTSTGDTDGTETTNETIELTTEDASVPLLNKPATVQWVKIDGVARSTSLYEVVSNKIVFLKANGDYEPIKGSVEVRYTYNTTGYHNLDVKPVLTNISDNEVAQVKITETGGSTDVIEIGGAASSGTVNALIDDISVYKPNSLTGSLIKITDGKGAGQVRTIQSNTNTSSGAVITVTSDWDAGSVPDGTSKYEIIRNVTPWVDYYNVVLTKAPDGDVKINVDPKETKTSAGRSINWGKQVSVSSSAPGAVNNGDGTVTLLFTTSNWDTPQIVKVAAVNDDVYDGDDTQVFAPQLHTISDIQGPLYLQGAGGNGSIIAFEPLMLHYELNIMEETGPVLDVSSDGTTIKVNKTLLMDSAYEINSDVNNVDDLVAENMTVMIAEGIIEYNPAPVFIKEIGQFRLIVDAVDNGDDTVTLTLNEAWDLVEGESFDMITKYKITNMSMSFFANEVEQIDYLFVYNGDSQADNEIPSRAGLLTDSTTVGFDGNSIVEEFATELDGKWLTGFGMGTEDLIVGGYKHPHGISYGDMEVVEINLGDGIDNFTVEDTHKRADGFQTWTIINTGGGDDVVTASLNTGVTELLTGSVTGTIAKTESTLNGDFSAFSTNELAGHIIEIIDGSGAGTRREIISNTQTGITVSSSWNSELDGTTVYSIYGDQDGPVSINAEYGDDIVDGSASTLPLIIFGGDNGVVGDTLTGGSADDIIFGDRGRVQYLNESGEIVTLLGLVRELINPEYVTDWTSTTLEDSEATFPVASIDQPGLEGLMVSITDGAGFRQDSRLILDDPANTGTLLHVTPAWETALIADPDGPFNSGDPDNNPSKYRISLIPEDQTDGVVRDPSLLIAIDETVGGDDAITGNAGSDRIFGGLGDDTIEGNADNDIIFGDHGRLDYTPEAVGGGNGPALGDMVPATINRIRTTFDNIGGADEVYGNEGEDIILGGYNPTGGADAEDVLFGNTGDDILLGDNGSLLFSPNTDTSGDLRDVYLDEIETLSHGTGGVDVITGNAGEDIIMGGAAGDTIYGDDESSSASSADGEDVIIGDNGRIELSGGVAGKLNAFGSAINIIKTTDNLESTGGADTVHGNADDDLIIGGVGGDTIYGDAPVQGGHDGTDLVLGDNGTVDFGADPDYLDSVSSSQYSTADSAVLGGDDTISGDRGSDTIIGGTGSDTIYGDNSSADAAGLDGEDIIAGDNATITYAADTYQESGQGRLYTLGDSTVSRVETTDTEEATGGSDTVHGNADDDLIIGGVGGDTIYGDAPVQGGYDGTDLVLGDNGTVDFGADPDYLDSVSPSQYSAADSAVLGGDDTISGDRGSDTIIGGTGSDTIYGDNSSADAAGLDGEDIIAGDNATITYAADTYQESGQGRLYTLGDSTVSRIETTDTEEATGGADTIHGNADDDLIVGGVNNGGTDTIYGDAPVQGGYDGTDLILGDNGTVDFGADPDYLDSVSSSQYSTADSAVLGGDDTISGDSGSDTIIGGTGSDTIYGDNSSADAAGLDGEDIIAGDNATITYAVDTYQESGQGRLYTLGDSTVSRIETTDTEEATGGADTVHGNADDDLIVGGVNNGGTDTIYGDAPVQGGYDGTDLILGDNGTVDFGADPDYLDSVSSSQYSTADSAVLGGDDTISGDRGSDTIIGGTGSDTIYGDNSSADAAGLDGEDIIAGDNATITYAADTYQESGQGRLYTLGDSTVSRVETTDTEEATGGADTIHGNAQTDVILGGVGGDTIYGDASTEGADDNADVILGDNGLISFAEDAGQDPATVELIKTERTDLGGIDTISGNDGDDIIFGGKDGDVIHGNANDDIILGDFGQMIFTGTYDSSAEETYDKVFFNSIARIAEITDNSEGGGDTIYGDGDEDILIGGAGSDNIDGDAGDDIIFGDNVSLARPDSPSGYNDDTNPRIRTLAGSMIYGETVGGNDGDALIDTTDRLIPDLTGTPVWADWNITLLNHSAADETAGLNNFGDDYIAGGGDDDTVFGQLGDDTIQGDGSIDGKIDQQSPVGAYRDPDGTLSYNSSFEHVTDGDDYIEGNGGNDVIFGNLGQDDIIGGSSSLFSLVTPDLRPDGTNVSDPDKDNLDNRNDIIFGGSGERIGRNNLVDGNNNGDIILNERHARDADMILGDNGNIYRLVSEVNAETGETEYLEFEYDQNFDLGQIAEDRGSLRIIPRAAELLDYTPGGPDYDPTASQAANDIGATDEIHGESGDDFIYGMKDNDILFGDSDDDDLIGGYGFDWISGGTGEDGVIGDDGRIYTSRNNTNDEPLYGIDGFANNELDEFIYTPGKIQQNTINEKGELKKTVNLTPFKLGNPDLFDYADQDPAYADDIIYGGWGDDFLHGGAGDDAISGAEALEESAALLFPTTGGPAPSRNDGVKITSSYKVPFNPGNIAGFEAFRADEFALYDEYNPLRKILLDADGLLSEDGTGTEFLLNFNAAEGPDDTTYDPAGTPSDGDDAIFGDLGNDWLVGGSGRDHMYGGYGSDLLNADDNHETNGGLNNAPDTDGTYEDTAYGGAGRDILIGNTGGDRLVDWTGEYNSYIVPFAPFGMGTVSRTLQPQLMEYLYDLSESDGADQTRAADTGADPARNGEPEGELGLVLQKDVDWQDQTGAPNDPQAGNIPGGKRDVLRSATFNSGQMEGFFADSGVWHVSDGALQVSAESLGGDAVSVFHVNEQLPNYYEIMTTINAEKPTAGWKSNAFVIFDYYSPTDFKFAGLNVSTDKIQMGRRTAEGWIVDVQSNVQVKPNINYNILVAVNGTNVTLVVDGTTFFSHTFAPRVIDGWSYGLNYGMVGVGSDNSRCSLDNITVQKLPPEFTFENTEDFSDNAADLFTGSKSGEWQIAGSRYNGTPVVDSDKAMSIIDLGLANGLEAASILEFNTTFNTQNMGGIVFDYYSPTDFKFVSINAETDQVIVGHHTEHHGWSFDAVTSKLIDPGTDYSLSISVKGSTVSVMLDGQAVLGHVFNSLLVDGSIGLLTANGESSFDVVMVKTDDPVFRVEEGSANLIASSAPAESVGEEIALTYDALGPIIETAVHRLSDSLILDDSSLALLEEVSFEVADLEGLMLAQTSGTTIIIDADAAGYGWFIDTTPDDDREFSRSNGDGNLIATPASDAYGDMDLLSVVMHELGHVLGFKHIDGNGLMDATLDVGERIVPLIEGNNGNGKRVHQSATYIFDESNGTLVDHRNYRHARVDENALTFDPSEWEETAVGSADNGSDWIVEV